MAPAAPPEDFDRHVRRVDPDRWLAARLVADAGVRTQVLALYALDDELARAVRAVSQPMLGEIRLQWWREALERGARGGAAEHPVITALAPALLAGRLPPDRLDGLLAAHVAALEPAGEPDAALAEAAIDGREGSLMALAAGLLDAAAPPDATLHAARAWGWSLRHAPAAVDAALKASRAELARLPVAAFPAVAYAALARSRARGRPPSELGDRARLLWAAARGRVD